MSRQINFFLDTADVEEIRKYVKMGLIQGVTTNPSLYTKYIKQLIADGKDKSDLPSYEGVISQINDIFKEEGIDEVPLSIEPTADSAEEIVAQGKAIYSNNKNAVIKVICDPDGIGLVTAKKLAEEGIPTNITLAFNPTQTVMAVMAQTAGAKIAEKNGKIDSVDSYLGKCYTNIFIGRVDDQGNDGIDALADAAEIFEKYDIPVKLISASIRHPLHIKQSLMAGADVLTIPPKALEGALKNLLTVKGIESFNKDFKESQEYLTK
jgi:transaldolase